jgi:hypothetical protein
MALCLLYRGRNLAIEYIPHLFFALCVVCVVCRVCRLRLPKRGARGGGAAQVRFAADVGRWLQQVRMQRAGSGPPRNGTSPWAIVSVGRSTELILLLALGFAVVCRRCQLESVRQLPEEAVGQIQVLVGPSSLHAAARWRRYTTPLTDIAYVSTNTIAVVVTRHVVEGD